VASISGTGETHYWPIVVPEKECVCPTFAPTSAPTTAPNCYDSCETEYLLFSGTDAESCGMYSWVISGNCDACSDGEMTTYVDQCLSEGCEPENCGCATEDVVEIEESVIVVPATIQLSDCPPVESEDELVDEVIIAVAAALNTGAGRITNCMLSRGGNNGRKLNDDSSSSATVSFNVVVDSNTMGSRQLATEIESLTSLGDMNVENADAGEGTAMLVKGYAPANDYAYDAADFSTDDNSGSSFAGTAAGVGGAVGGLALVVAAAVAAKKRTARAIETTQNTAAASNNDAQFV
jgi:hypothetical protein